MIAKQMSKIWYRILEKDLERLNISILLDVRNFIDQRNKSGKPIKHTYSDPVDRVIDPEILTWHHDGVTRTLQVEEENTENQIPVILL